MQDAFPRASTSSANDSSAHLVDSFRRTSLALLNEIEDLYFRERSGETSRGNKRENDSREFTSAATKGRELTPWEQQTKALRPPRSSCYTEACLQSTSSPLPPS